ncbi:MAG: hypothetical protein AB7T63_06530 [Planctomycetota bacterium]
MRPSHFLSRLRPLRRRAFIALLALLVALPLATPAAHAGEDDFDFAQALAGIGQATGDKAYFEYARKVLRGMLQAPGATDEQKDLAAYGMARLSSDEARGALARAGVPFKDLVKLFEDACDALEAFVSKYPKHPRANEARLQIGTTRLGFAQFVKDSLLGDGDEMELRGTTAVEVQSAARSFVESAGKHFDNLRQGYNGANPTDLQLIAHYNWVLCQHYKALVEPACSSAARKALELAAVELETFVFDYDGTLIAVYAQDISGLNFAEIGKCAREESERESAYRSALSWFDTCMQTPNESPEHLEVITRGFFHYARTCLEIREMGGVNYLRVGVTNVSPMLDRYPDARLKDNGVRAWIELGKIHAARQSYDQAISVLDEAATFAKTGGMPALEALANREIAKVVENATGSLDVDADIMIRIGNARMADERWADAIAMFQQALAALPRTRENLDKLVDLWKRLSSCYSSLGDDLGAALSLDPIHELWQDGVAPRSTRENDPNLIEYGNLRLAAIARWKRMADETKSTALEERFKAMRSAFAGDYPGHPQEKVGVWNEALDLLQQGSKAKGGERERLLKRAAELLKQVAKDATNQKQDDAWAYQARVANMLGDNAGVLRVHQEATAYWATPEAMQQVAEHESIRKRREDARGELVFWAATALVDQKKWDDVLQMLDGYHGTYGAWRTAKKDSNDFTFYSGTMAYMVEAYLGKDDIENAIDWFRRLLRVAPESSRLPIITQRLASFYNDQAKGIEDRLRTLIAESGTLKGQFTTTEKTYYLKAGARNAAGQELRRLKDKIKAYDEVKAKGEDPLRILKISETEYKADKKRAEELEGTVERLAPEIEQLSKEMTTITARRDEIQAQLNAGRDELYEPRRRAAEFYYELWSAQKEGDSPTPTENVRVFADLYRRAALLRPDVEENWSRARELYESYLARPDAKGEQKQEAMGELGGIYYRLAVATKDKQVRAQLVEQARERLQASMAQLPENNSIMVALLKNELVAYQWTSPADGSRPWFLLRVVSTVPELKAQVRDMGTPAGPPVLAFEREGDRNRYKQGMDTFQQYVANVYRDNQLQQLVGSLKKAAGFNQVFWATYANPSKDFRLALAWVFSESGNADDAPKAVQLADSLVRGNSRMIYEEESEDWWLATVLGLRARVAYAEALWSQEQASDRTKAVINGASTFLTSLQNSYPQLGAPERPQTLDELVALQERVDSLRTRADLPRLDLILRRGELKVFGADGASGDGTGSNAPGGDGAGSGDEPPADGALDDAGGN